MPEKQLVPFTSPIKGVVQATPRGGQPLETAWDAQNVLPYDRYGRKRCGQRGGLGKQYPNQMTDNFVQGMIEAPNIIYPPNEWSVPIGSIDDLVNPFTFTNGDFGPFSHSYPTANFRLAYEWEFSYSVHSVRTGPAPGISNAVCVFFWPINDDDEGNLILVMTGATTLDVAIEGFMSLYTGDPVDDGTWIPLSVTQPYKAVAGAGGDQTAVFDCKITIYSDGQVTLFIDGGDPEEVTVTHGLGVLNYPELNVQSVSIVDGSPPGTTTTTTLLITD